MAGALIARTLLPVVLCMLSAAARAGYSEDNRFLLNLGVYEQTDHRTRINLADTALGIGAGIDLEEDLNVADSTGRVFRLDGHYRFSRAHRIEWTWYRARREGFVEIFDENIELGGLPALRFGASVESAIEYGVLKLGYAWSFVNSGAWELNLGVGLNFYRDSVHVTARVYNGLEVDITEHKEEADGPLPTASLGARYQPGKWALYWDYEVVTTELGEFSGRLRESIIGIEHDTWEHAGFGLGLINAADFVETEDGGMEGEFDSSYRGWRLYLKTMF